MCGNMLFMDPQKSWLLIGRAKLISTNGPSFTFCTQPLYVGGVQLKKLPLVIQNSAAAANFAAAG